MTCHPSNDLPTAHYDVLFANNCIFYVHPRRLRQEISRLLAAVKPGGRLFLLDIPVIQRLNTLSPSGLKQLWWRITRVYQPIECGFFLDERWVCETFSGARVLDSWSPYRAHFEIRR